MSLIDILKRLLVGMIYDRIANNTLPIHLFNLRMHQQVQCVFIGTIRQRSIYINADRLSFLNLRII